MNQWLDEVRAQRQAWEERRRAAKEVINARRREIDPWGAAKQEAWEEENQRRREAFLQRIEREREVFRSQAPWGTAQTPWQDKPPDQDSRPEAMPQGHETVQDPTSKRDPYSPYPMLPGWDNRWYYRGY
jgi:hypothetical protein